MAKRNSTHNDDPLQVSTHDEWNTLQAEGVRVRLPFSGLVVRLRDVYLTDLAANGEIPDELTPQLNALSADESEDATLLGDQLVETREMMRNVVDPIVCLAVMEPVFALPGNEQPGHSLPITRMPTGDRMRIWRWLNAGADRLKFFRAQPEDAVAPAPDLPDLRDAAE